jgi:uncharacterized membrane protein YhiD involved in acid resistance
LDFFASESSISLQDILLRMGVAGFLGIAVGLTYHRTFRGLTYSVSFRNTNVLITIIICAIILSIGSNVALSLGLVGSLSVIRFRAVVKDAMDMIYLFWSIGIGIACGAGQFQIAGALFGLVLLVILAITYNPLREVVKDRFMIKVVYAADADVAGVEDLLRERFRGLSLRSSFRSEGGGTTEATYLVKLADRDVSSAEAIFAGAQPGVVSAQLVRFDGIQAL